MKAGKSEPATEPTDQGPQYLMPGTAPLPATAHTTARPGRGHRTPDDLPLFSDARNQPRLI